MASAICGTSDDKITWFAETVVKELNVFISHGYAAARCDGAEDGYPLLMFSSYYPRAACSNFGIVATLREAWVAPVESPETGAIVAWLEEMAEMLV